MPRRLLSWIVAATVVIGTAACSQERESKSATPRVRTEGSTPAAPPSTAPAPVAPTATVAEARGPEIEVFGERGDTAPTHTFESPNFFGAPSVFLVREERGDWLKVLLPMRPNGTAGWVRRSDVTVTSHDYRIVVETESFKLTVYDGNEVFHEEKVGVGTGGYPTPTGTFFTMTVLQPPSPGGPYGAYAIGLSGFSEVLQSFGGGPGQVAIHGTNAPGALGTAVSHGCVRMSNDGITKLRSLPLGVPVEIKP